MQAEKEKLKKQTLFPFTGSRRGARNKILRGVTVSNGGVIRRFTG